ETHEEDRAPRKSWSEFGQTHRPRVRRRSRRTLEEIEGATDMAKKPTNHQPLTTAQRLGSLVKSARDIMRKDKGLNGDLDRLPMLTWVMFLKFLDDLEQVREQKAVLAGGKFRPAVEKPYRWRDWAAKED